MKYSEFYKVLEHQHWTTNEDFYLAILDGNTHPVFLMFSDDELIVAARRASEHKKYIPEEASKIVEPSETQGFWGFVYGVVITSTVFAIFYFGC